MSRVRPIETFLAPGFSRSREAHPFREDNPRTEERARLLIADAIAGRASDIHIEPGPIAVRLRFRIDGSMHDVAEIPKDSAIRLVRYFKVAGGLDTTDTGLAQDGHAGLVLDADTTAAVRLSSVPSVGGERLAIRLLDAYRRPLHLPELGLDERDIALIQDWLNEVSGLVAICGPTGVGKSTTLYALLEEIRNFDRCVITVEDPVEREMDGITQIEVTPQRGMTFASGLRSMLRLDPDFMVVGEIRDEASNRIAIEAAGAGRVVITTLHASDAVGAITALRNYGAHDFEIAAAVSLVIAQRLVRVPCRECRVREAPSAREQNWANRISIALPDQCWHTRGCKACHQRGYSGRTGIFEVWHLDHRSHQLIQEHADVFALHDHLCERRIPLMLQHGIAKALAGETTFTELLTLGNQAPWLHQTPTRLPRKM
jgi:general secretion pathway protein E